MGGEVTVSTRAKSPTRAEAIAKALTNRPVYSSGVLIENWVEDRTECPKTGTLYFPPKEVIDYEKLKPETRTADYNLNKLNSTQSAMPFVIRHDSHATCSDFATVNDLVYNHLPKPYCGPIQRTFKISQNQWVPQPDLMKCFVCIHQAYSTLTKSSKGNVTEWGLRKYLLHEWKCTTLSDYMSTLYEDTYVPPKPHEYLPRNERKARNATFTKTFRYSMTKPIKR